MESLEEEFCAWLRSRSDIHDLDKEPALVGHKHADFLYEGHIVIEVKGLHASPDKKIDRLLKNIESRREFSRLKRPFTIIDAVNVLPDRIEVQRKLDQALSGSVKTAYRKAKTQIDETIKRVKGANFGVLIFFNEKINRFSPQDVGVIVSKMLAEDKRKNCKRVDWIGSVIILSAAHFVLTFGDLWRPLIFPPFCYPLAFGCAERPVW